jgi:hypothetical protein
MISLFGGSEMTSALLARGLALTLLLLIAPFPAGAQERCFRDQNGQLKCCDQNGSCYYPDQR